MTDEIPIRKIGDGILRVPTDEILDSPLAMAALRICACGHHLDREHDYRGVPWTGARCRICRSYCNG